MSRSELLRGNTHAMIHGMSRHALYPTWANMMTRCYKEHHPRYPDWGGRGITVAPEWHDPRAFIEYLIAHLGPRPPRWSLDRINNNGNYEPGNLRWANPQTQTNNSRPKRLSEKVGRSGNSPGATNARKTHCLRGHPFDEANTYITGRGYRQCRICKYLQKRRVQEGTQSQRPSLR